MFFKNISLGEESGKKKGTDPRKVGFAPFKQYLYIKAECKRTKESLLTCYNKTSPPILGRENVLFSLPICPQSKGGSNSYVFDLPPMKAM